MELEKFIFFKYYEIVFNFLVESDVKENIQKLIIVIDKYGDELYREIDNIINEMKFDFEKMEFYNIKVLKIYKNNIISVIFEIIKNIVDLKKLLKCSYINFNYVFGYKFRNVEFKRFLFKFIVFLVEFLFQVL